MPVTRPVLEFEANLPHRMLNAFRPLWYTPPRDYRVENNHKVLFPPPKDY